MNSSTRIIARKLSTASKTGSLSNEKKIHNYYHLSGTVLAVGAPVALMLAPSTMNVPVDLALGVILPFHGHVGMNYIIGDYVPRAARGVARAALIGTTFVTALGLARLNIAGPGITTTVKSLWGKKED